MTLGTRVRLRSMFFANATGTVIGVAHYGRDYIVQLDKPLLTEHGEQTGFVVGVGDMEVADA